MPEPYVGSTSTTLADTVDHKTVHYRNPQIGSDGQPPEDQAADPRAPATVYHRSEDAYISVSLEPTTDLLRFMLGWRPCKNAAVDTAGFGGVVHTDGDQTLLDRQYDDRFCLVGFDEHHSLTTTSGQTTTSKAHRQNKQSYRLPPCQY